MRSHYICSAFLLIIGSSLDVPTRANWRSAIFFVMKLLISGRTSMAGTEAGTDETVRHAGLQRGTMSQGTDRATDSPGHPFGPEGKPGHSAVFPSPSASGGILRF